MIFKERSTAMVFNETTIYDFILASKQAHTQLIFLCRGKMIVAWCCT